MHRKASLILLAFAVFAFTLSPLIRWYAFPKLVQIPQGRYQEAVLEAKNATLMDYATLKPRKVSKVTIIQTLKGNVEQAAQVKEETGKDVVVWDTLSHMIDEKGKMVGSIPERYYFDGHTQEPVHATGEAVDGDPVRRTGIEYKFPFLTEKRDYEYYDMQTRTSAPIHYKGTENFRGMDVYRFEQTIPWTKVKIPKKLPLGVTPKVVQQMGLERWYSTKRWFLIDPTTGAPVNGGEFHKEEMRWTKTPEKEPLTAFSGNVKMRPDYVDSIVDEVSSQRQLVLLMHTYMPIGLIAGGGVLLGLSLWLEARSRRPAADAGSGATAPEPVRA
ncbi:DUF3068 domain-containing protein [Streptomyces sp. A7024]|uniref:DUF3068 domain-containing protein n=1 Tax=Streptomyces coryli TaxID=1128680 RepID=A0A6G4UF16_9ACTN|nr:DUF3068 domain-containing protein [Streptomyces coryli]NGN70351.1 DUF3068 domain-containing protein [Streptomyces coryli]